VNENLLGISAYLLGYIYILFDWFETKELYTYCGNSVNTTEIIDQTFNHLYL